MGPTDPHERHRASPQELKALHEMQRSGQAFLSWRDGSGALQLAALDPAGGGLTIGRAPQAGIALTWDDAVSSLHAELTPRDREWLIVDDGLSRNGTFVDGKRVDGRTRLRHDVRIVVGETILVFHAQQVGDAETKHLEGMVQREDFNDNDWRVLVALCRPMVLDGARTPATNEAIAYEVSLTVDGVKRCLTRLFTTFAVDEQAPSKRVALAQAAMASGLVRRRLYA